MNKTKTTIKTGKIPVLSIVGTSNTGKTVLLTNLIPRLKARRIRVGVIKHHGHRGGRKTHSRSDTALIRDSGAAVTILAGPGINGNDDESPQEIIKREMTGKVDLVLTEGYKKGPFPKIGISWPGRPDQLEPDENWIASIGGDFDGLPFFNINDDKGLTEFIISRMFPEGVPPPEPPPRPKPPRPRKKAVKVKKVKTAAPKKAAEVTLKVNGRDIKLNRFVAAFIIRTISGMLSSLKGCEDPKRTVIRIKHGK